MGRITADLGLAEARLKVTIINSHHAFPPETMTHFTPWSALAGGALIGLAAVLLLWLNGRIAGISGIAGGLWPSTPPERAWRLRFIGGLIVGTLAWIAWSDQPAPLRSGFPPALLMLAGLLVGYGTSLGGGCTSGHGVCGLARFSTRSLVATTVFLVVAITTTFVMRHLLQIA
jgi:uncharacterized membrane protein YedE/YeeE